MIRALPDLCLGIVSERLGHLDSLDLFHGLNSLKAPARPGLFVPNGRAHERGQGEVFQVIEGRPEEEAGSFSEPEIEHFVMAITAAEAIVRHTPPHPTA